MARDKAWMVDELEPIVSRLAKARGEAREVIQRLLNAGYTEADIIAAIEKFVTPEQTAPAKEEGNGR